MNAIDATQPAADPSFPPSLDATRPDAQLEGRSFDELPLARIAAPEHSPDARRERARATPGALS